MSSNNDPISIEEFRNRHGLPATTEFALSHSGGRGYTVWVPRSTDIPRGWSSAGSYTDGFQKLRPHGNYREGKAAGNDLVHADIPRAEEIHANLADDMEIADKLLAAAERMGAIVVTRRDGSQVVFTPAPTSPGVRFP
ncbi:hypothetical protein [Nocardiopsis sp. FR26]|uniref:hypothetical protein n=1 Tax=Nocardiopsis sp. FR26 TaxID=2605987 RepID=UPI00135AACA3|nr:hypothetical protein [Nocardiopsis sp. FR26]